MDVRDSRVGRHFCAVEYLDDYLFIMAAATARLIYCWNETRAFPARIPQTLSLKGGADLRSPLSVIINRNISRRLRKRSLIRTNWKFIAIRNKLGRRLLSLQFREFVNQEREWQGSPQRSTLMTEMTLKHTSRILRH